MRIGTKCYEHITITKAGEQVAKLTDNELTLAQGYEFSAACVESSISREELLRLALYAVEDKIQLLRIRAGSNNVDDFIVKVTPLIEKRDILRKALDETKAE